MPKQYNVVGYEALAISTAAVKLASRPTSALSFVGRLETANVRFRGDGTSPTTSEGVLLRVNDIIVLNDSEIDRTEFIRVSSDATLRGHYYTTEAGMFT